MLGWQAQFTAGAGQAFMRLHAHLPSAYCRAATQAGLVIRTCDEALLAGDNVATPTAVSDPDANRQAYVGLPGVIVWSSNARRRRAAEHAAELTGEGRPQPNTSSAPGGLNRSTMASKGKLTNHATIPSHGWKKAMGMEIRKTATGTRAATVP